MMVACPVHGRQARRGIQCVALAVIAALVASTAYPEQVDRAQSDSQENQAARIKADVAFLSDDLLKGRLAGTAEYEIAARYVASELQAIGVAPNVANYLQAVPLRRAWLDESTARVTLHVTEGAKTRERKFTVGEDFLMGGNAAHQQASVTAPLVFVGFGVRAPDLDYDDYAGIDAQGKIVVALSGSPGTVLKDDARSEQWAHYRTLKLENAVAAGAVGFVSLHTPNAERVFSWQRRAAHRGDASVRWLAADGVPHRGYPQLKGRAALSMQAAAEIFSQAPQSFKKVLRGLKRGRIAKGFDMGVSLTLFAQSRHEDTHSSNVLGVLRGTDPKLTDEFVVVSAHLDHIGVTERDGKTLVNNGAIDNAMGVALMLETARMLASGPPPARSVIFAAVTAEEAGLIGADYLAHHPPIGQGRLVANVNLDGPMLLYPFASLIGFGAERSTLGTIAATASERHGVRLQPDPLPEQGFFTRSDHYMFVRQGVPSLFLVPGFDSLDPQLDGREQFLGYLSGPYHSPEDNMDLPILWPYAARMAQINGEIIVRVANAPEAPRWHEGDFFGETFGSSSQTESEARDAKKTNEDLAE